jgi:hypothetical protein
LSQNGSQTTVKNPGSALPLVAAVEVGTDLVPELVLVLVPVPVALLTAVDGLLSLGNCSGCTASFSGFGGSAVATTVDVGGGPATTFGVGGYRRRSWCRPAGDAGGTSFVPRPTDHDRRAGDQVVAAAIGAMSSERVSGSATAAPRCRLNMGE